MYTRLPTPNLHLRVSKSPRMWHTRDWISDPFLNKPPKLSPSAYEPAANCVPPGAQGRLLRVPLVSFPPLTLHISKPCAQGSTCDTSPAKTTSHLKSDPLAKHQPHPYSRGQRPMCSSTPSLVGCPSPSTPHSCLRAHSSGPLHGRPPLTGTPFPRNLHLPPLSLQT